MFTKLVTIMLEEMKNTKKGLSLKMFTKLVTIMLEEMKNTKRGCGVILFLLLFRLFKYNYSFAVSNSNTTTLTVIKILTANGFKVVGSAKGLSSNSAMMRIDY